MVTLRLLAWVNSLADPSLVTMVTLPLLARVSGLADPESGNYGDVALTAYMLRAYTFTCVHVYMLCLNLQNLNRDHPCVRYTCSFPLRPDSFPWPPGAWSRRV